MIKWLNVTGIVRIDSMEPVLYSDVIETFGEAITMSSPGSVFRKQKKNPELFLPTGDEGSLKLEFIRTNEEVNQVLVCIYGYLKDYEKSEEDIIEWFKEVIYKNPKFIVMQACITIKGNNIITWAAE